MSHFIDYKPKSINSLMTRLIYPDVKPLYSSSSVISSISYIIRLLDYICESNYDFLDELILLQDFLSSLKKKLSKSTSELNLNLELKPFISICSQIIKKSGYESDYPAKMWLLRVINESKSINDSESLENIKINYELYNPLILTEIDKEFIDSSLTSKLDSEILSESIQTIFLPKYLIRVCLPSFLEYLSFICTPHYLHFSNLFIIGHTKLDLDSLM
jgi:hypothetical protein